MKKLKLQILLFGVIASQQLAFATDRIVADGGQGGAFSTITQAITASVANDRILVYPKSGGSPYTENIVINKNIQILCAVEGKYFGVNGAVAITLSPQSRRCRLLRWPAWRRRDSSRDSHRQRWRTPGDAGRSGDGRRR